MKIDFYNFYYTMHSDDENVTTFLASTVKAELLAVLPFGRLTIAVNITDELGAVTSYLIQEITTILPSNEQFDEYNLTATVEKMSGSPLISMYITAYNSVNVHNEKATLAAVASMNSTSGEGEDILLSLTEQRNEQLAIIEETPHPTNIEQATVTSGAIASSVELVLSVDSAAYLIDTETKDKVIHLMDRTTDSVDKMEINSLDQIISLIKNTMTAKVGITKSTNVILADERIPVGDLEMAFNLDYDVGVGNIPDTPEKMYIYNALEAIKENAKVQTNQLNAILNRQSNQIIKRLASDSSVHINLDDGLNLILTKIKEEHLESNSMSLFSDTKPLTQIQFPEGFCVTSYIIEESICVGDFSSRLLVSDIDSRSYCENSHYISDLSYIVSLSVLIGEDIIDIQNEKPPIQITIPHHPLNESDNLILVNVSDYKHGNIPLVYHSVNVSRPQAALLIRLQEIVDKNLIILIDNERYPTPENHFLKYHLRDFQWRNGIYSLLIDSSTMKNKTGLTIIAIGQLTDNYETYLSKDQFITHKDLNSLFNSRYYISIFLTACYYFDQTNDLWRDEYHLMVTDFNISHTVCSTPHLTEFGVAFQPLPITIHFEIISPRTGMFDGASPMMTVIFIISIFLILFAFSIYKDRVDKKRAVVTALPDNKINNNNLYEITFHTGPSSEATCTSKISIILSGDRGETGIRELPQSNFLYRRYNKDTFVLATESSLGIINNIRIMHDNSGRPPYDSWQLEKVVVFDLQNEKSTLFVINEWLTLDRESCVIDKIFSSDIEDNSSFSQRMYSNIHTSINQDHLWISIFLCSPGCRYKSSQRVLVAACFILLSMMVSSCYYSYGDVNLNSDGFEIFSLIFTVDEMLVSIVSLLSSYLIILPMSFVFRRVKPQILSRNRSLVAIEIQKSSLEKESNLDQRGQSNKSEDSWNSTIRQKIKPTVRMFSWYLRWVLYLISLTIIAGSTGFILLLSFSWKNAIARKWITASIISILSSLLISEWFIVGFLALLKSVSKPGTLYQDIDYDENLPKLMAKSKTTKIDETSVLNINLIKGIGKERIKEVNKKLKINRQLRKISQETLLYCCFLVVLIVITSDRSDPNAFLLQEHFSSFLIKEGSYLANVNKRVSFRKSVIDYRCLELNLFLQHF